MAFLKSWMWIVLNVPEWNEVIVESFLVMERKIIRANKRCFIYYGFMLMARWQGRSMLASVSTGDDA